MRRATPIIAVLFLLVALPSARSEDPPAQQAAPAVPGSRSAQSAAPDRIELDAALIRGNQELPKVLYIVPWKEPGPAEPAGRPLNSLVDEALAPVDREVFRRQMTYFDQLYARPGAALGESATGPARE